MEKLVKLLNEYHFSGTEYVGYYLDEDENRIYFRTKVVDKGLVDEQRISDERVISKKFGFIKWLVDNDKINRKKLEIRPFSDELVYSDSDCTVYRSDTTYEMLLMLLAISNEPTNDLISYLK